MPDNADNSSDNVPADEGDVLTPDDLDISSDENVVEIDEGRYVISPSGTEPSVRPARETKPTQADPADELQSSVLDIDEETVHGWLEARLDRSDAHFAFDVTARFDGSIEQKSLFSNDVVATFENLIVWFAQHAGGDTPVEEVLGILLMESNLSIRFPPSALQSLVTAHGLGGDDSVDEFLAAANDEGGIRFPPERN